MLDKIKQVDGSASGLDADLLDGVDSGAIARRGSEAWIAAPLHLPATGCGFTNFGNGFGSAAYFRDDFGVVHLKGVVQAGDGFLSACGANNATDAVILTLPAGYRPGDRSIYAVVANNKPARVDVNSNGVVQMEPNFPTYTDAKAFLSLDGITFRCAPTGSNGCP